MHFTTGFSDRMLHHVPFFTASRLQAFFQEHEADIITDSTGIQDLRRSRQSKSNLLWFLVLNYRSQTLLYLASSLRSRDLGNTIRLLVGIVPMSTTVSLESRICRPTIQASYKKVDFSAILHGNKTFWTIKAFCGRLVLGYL